MCTMPRTSRKLRLMCFFTMYTILLTKNDARIEIYYTSSDKRTGCRSTFLQQSNIIRAFQVVLYFCTFPRPVTKLPKRITGSPYLEPREVLSAGHKSTCGVTYRRELLGSGGIRIAEKIHHDMIRCQSAFFMLQTKTKMYVFP